MMRFTLLILMALLPCLIFAATLSVKQDGSGDYTVIQDALDAANPGDTVLVYPGRYFENLTIESDNITLMSLEATTGDPAYIDSTIIDGNNINPCIIISQHTSNNTIRGFSITKGMRSLGNGGGLAIGFGSTTNLINCEVFQNQALTGGGIGISGADITLHGTSLYENYALHLGGGMYASTGGSTYNITFDPINRCSIYNNRAGSGQDIYIQNATSDLYMPLDAFSVSEPHNYHAVYKSVNPNLNNFRINFDILNAHHQEIDSDLYVSTVGDDANDGLSPATALKTIHEAIYRVASDSLNQNTVHILPGDYSRTDNDQIFPISLKSWVIVQGSGIDTTTVIGEPHPDMGDDAPSRIFSAIMEPSIFLSDLSITARNMQHYCNAIGGMYRRSNMSFANLRIYDIIIDPLFYGHYSIVYLGATSEKESIWENVTIENMGNAVVSLVDIIAGISENGDVSAFNGSFKNCVFRNATSTYVSSSVGAQSLIGIVGDKFLEFENCEFSNLTMLDDDSTAIAVVGIQYPQQINRFLLRNCLFSNNVSQGGIVSIASSNNPLVDIINCTFAGNQGDAYNLIVNGKVNIVNSIFDNDTPYQIMVNPMNGNPNEHTNLTIDHSLIKDGIAGILPYPVPGNTIDFLPSSMDADPLFVGGFDIHDPLYYSLSNASPCIDAGTPDISALNLPPYDLVGNQRVWNGVIDMGCFEYGSEPWVSNDDPVAPTIPKTSITAYPNPFSALTNIKISLQTDFYEGKLNSANLRIYNLRGQLVKSIALDPTKSGDQLTFWDGRDVAGGACANGIYFLRLECDGLPLETKKISLIK